MKKLLVIATVVAGAYGASAQGLISFNNSSSGLSKISVNSFQGGPATGLATGPAGTFLYELFYAPGNVTTVGGSAAPVIPTISSPGLYAFEDSNWKDALAGGTSSATPGRVTGSTAQVVTGVGLAGNANFVVIGWSAAIGPTIGSLQQYLANPFFGNVYVGESAVANLTLGDGNAVPTPAVLGGSSIPGFTLGIIQEIPEPTAIALGVFGGLALLGLRRKQA